MRKFFVFIIVSMMCWGVGLAQVPDVPQGVVCAFPTVLDSLTGETPVCPTLGMPSVAFSGTDPNRLVFTTPIFGGAVFDGMQAKFVMTVSGVSGTFYTNASLNTESTQLLGGVTITGDTALQGQDLRGKTLYVTAQITGCHAADATDPTSSAGVASETVSFTVPLPCPAFYETKDTISGATYRMISHIQLGSLYQYQNPLFVVKEGGGGDSTTITASYRSDFEFRSVGLPTSYWEGKIITFYPVLDLKCGSDMSAFVKIVGPSFTRSFLHCPELGNISLHSNNSPSPHQRQDTLFVAVSNYTVAAVAGVGVTVTPQGAASSVNWTLDQWTANHNAVYKVLTLAELQQLGLSTANLTASVTANLTVNPGAQGCSNASVSGQIVLSGLPECPAFAPNATTVVTQQSNGSLLATTALLHYNPALIHHTGVVDQDSLYYTLYVNTADTTHAGTLSGSFAAVYDALTQTMTCTLPSNQVTFGARYDFVPHVNLTAYCNSLSDAPVTIDGPSGYVVPVLRCPSYSPTTMAVRNVDGSVTVTHQIVDYNPALMHPTTMPKVYMYDSINYLKKTRSDIIIDANGLLSCTFPASDFEAYESQSMHFVPRFYRVISCGQPGYGPASNSVCTPTANLPTLTALSHSDGMGKVNLFKNEGVILKAKVSAPNAYFSLSQIAQAGFLLSREPITEYSADKAVVGTLVGTTGDTISYKVGMDSCGGVTYFRPYVLLGGCDPKMVLGPQSSFEMWAPDFTVSANPTHVAAGGSVTLDAVASMTVGTWVSQTNYGIPCQEIVSFVNICGVSYTEDCTPTKNMEVWMSLLVGLRNCPSFWNNFSSIIYNSFGMDPGNADFQYRWERDGVTFFSTTSATAPGTTTDAPTATTVYTGVADLTYNGVHCVQKRKITVAVP